VYLCTYSYDLINCDLTVCGVHIQTVTQIFTRAWWGRYGRRRGKGMVTYIPGRAIAQAVIRRLPTAAARVRVQVRSCGVCGGQRGAGAGFVRVLRFPQPILVPPTAPHSSSIVRAWYNRPVSGRRTKWTQSHPTPINAKKRGKKKQSYLPYVASFQNLLDTSVLV
jgi:hypothetical protein